MNPAQFAKESYQELRKATWLPRQQALESTRAIVIIVVILAAYSSAIDLILSRLLAIFLVGR